MLIREAVKVADEADLEDGAWMAMIEYLTGLDAGHIAGWLYKHGEHGKACSCPRCEP